ncbi:MAG: response regulator, partial [Chlorobiota bacterium]
MIYQVVDNLVNNALKYTSSGWVRVSTGIRGTGNNRTAFIRVEDSGIGIAPGKINVIFEPFRQGDEGVTRNYEGAGLGLTIAKKYVEMMGGELTVESTLGQGSVFTAGFTLAHDAADEEPEDDSAEKKLILVVEDDESASGLIKMYLQPFCDVVVVATGNEALLTLTEQRFDLAIIDINLPGSENGIELRDRIKEIDVYEDLPMIAVTAYTLPGDQMRFIEIGFNSFIEKPFRRELLVDTVMSLL